LREEDTGRPRLVQHLFVPEEESQMFRTTRIVPSAILTIAALALAPAAQAKPFIGQSGGAGDVSPIVQSIQSTTLDKQARGSVVTTCDMPLANPVQLPENLSAGLMHASTVHVAIDKVPTAPVSVPDSSGNGFDWTAAAIGAGLSGILMLMLAAGVGFRRRGQLAA
jgi:hypothetical protein